MKQLMNQPLKRLMPKLLIAMFYMGIGLSANAAFDNSAWDSLLKKNVVELKDGQASQVNYAGMQRDHASLKAYLNMTSQVSQAEFDHWSKNEQLAFLINAYNAWTVELILTRYPNLKSIKDIGSLFSSPWKKDFIPLLGTTRSLDDIEQGLIRGSGRYHEPRIHFAVNCASIGCPALRREAYDSDHLNTQLEQATQSFLQDRTRNYLKGNTLYVSSIFKWYSDDFEKGWRGIKSVAQFFGLYAQPLGLNKTQTEALKQGQIHIDYLPYDWHLNKTK